MQAFFNGEEFRFLFLSSLIRFFLVFLRHMLDRILFLLPIWILLDIYFFQVFKSALSGLPALWRKTLYILYWAFDGALIAAILYLKFTGSGIFSSYFFSLVGPILLSIIPKLIMLPFVLLKDVSLVFRHKLKKENTNQPGRRKFLNQIIVGASSIPFAYVGFGITRGPYHYTVQNHTLYFEDLPTAFDGFKITQLSDIHSGSLKDKIAVEKGIQLANAQKSDLIVLTGDIVNNQAEELNNWKDVFSKLSAPSGVYSILGNHDYGDYKDWDSPQEKEANLERLKSLQKEMGFRLLLNEHVKIQNENAHINLVGVENWGKRFHQYGDLELALKEVQENSFSVLLSHDPSHWDAQVLQHPKKVQLTLSGHTHGMQLGIEIPGLKWSPAKYMYKQWAGIYKKGTQYINVNRGFGFLGFAGRIGIWPEITVITLKKG